MAQAMQPMPLQIAQAQISPGGTDSFSVVAENRVTINAGGDFDGDPLDDSDDALIYGGDGFTFNTSPTLPVQRDEQGNPITDEQGRPILVENAVAVSAAYSQINAPNNPYAGLIPPTIVPDQIVEVQSYQGLRNQTLAERIPPGTPTQTFNSSQNPINNAADWANKFPSGGEAGSPTVVEVTNGLNVPDGVDIAHQVIILLNGGLNFNGSGHTLNDVVLVTNNGNINLATVQATDTAILSSGGINMNGGARFAGSSLIANNGSLNFNGATSSIDPEDTLQIVVQQDLTFNASANTRGELRAGEISRLTAMPRWLGLSGRKAISPSTVGPQ
ncbi:MAG: hypothetical protein HC921_17865 [Synechococcaceae cyanobacterium SM2_3_1]|nr:hypothetical protein [Synechococcaceae cyanobacterium SM2_3_1]